MKFIEHRVADRRVLRLIQRLAHHGEEADGCGARRPDCGHSTEASELGARSHTLATSLHLLRARFVALVRKSCPEANSTSHGEVKQ